jgi:hypothetical protein
MGHETMLTLKSFLCYIIRTEGEMGKKQFSPDWGLCEPNLEAKNGQMAKSIKKCSKTGLNCPADVVFRVFNLLS